MNCVCINMFIKYVLFNTNIFYLYRLFFSANRIWYVWCPWMGLCPAGSGLALHLYLDPDYLSLSPPVISSEGKPWAKKCCTILQQLCSWQTELQSKFWLDVMRKAKQRFLCLVSMKISCEYHSIFLMYVFYLFLVNCLVK